MIDWQILVDGQFPPGWNTNRDGCWFPDFDHQEYMLPYFNVGDSPIDPYDSTVFVEEDLRRLREHLNDWRGYVEAKPDVWTITESHADTSRPDSSRTILLNREKILAVIDKTLDMVELALTSRGTLVFCGD